LKVGIAAFRKSDVRNVMLELAFIVRGIRCQTGAVTKLFRLDSAATFGGEMLQTEIGARVALLMLAVFAVTSCMPTGHAVNVTFAFAAEIVMFAGSSSSVPLIPKGAAASLP
jgi:hypothetical protein